MKIEMIPDDGDSVVVVVDEALAMLEHPDGDLFEACLRCAIADVPVLIGD